MFLSDLIRQIRKIRHSTIRRTSHSKYAKYDTAQYEEWVGVNMNSLTISSKKEKVNFLFPSELNQKANAIATSLGFTYSDFVRQALAEFVEKIERERINREIVEACKYFSETDKQIADEWRSVETGI